MIDRNRILMLAIALATVGVLALGWFLGVSPRLDQMNAANAERAAVEATNATYEAQLAQLIKDFEGIDEIRDQLAEIAVKLPAETALDVFIRALDSYAAETSVALQRVDWQPPAVVTAEGAAAADPAATPDGLVPAGTLVSINVSLEVQGRIDTLSSFLERLQAVMPRYALVAGISLSRTTGENADSDGYIASIALALFVITAAPVEVAPEPEPTEAPSEPATDPDSTPTPDPTETAPVTTP
jgi:predicted transcriptional regulator